MKKMLILAAVALCAVFAKASQIDWQFSTKADYKGYTVYIVSELADFASVDEIKAKTIGTAGNSGTISGSRTFLAKGTVDGVTAEAGSTVDFYYVVLGTDEKSYWTMASSSEAYTTATSYAKSAITTAQSSELFATTAKTLGVATPEPTSGLLLLVGGAALALRRKQK